ncbi:hypothetical protein FMEAI12_1670010 [Parafrankia sp. Ea1.12]|nr:hypothetical protein FMEAI12_1670010 [Parafrankia sp. Ea1.12]
MSALPDTDVRDMTRRLSHVAIFGDESPPWHL